MEKFIDIEFIGDSMAQIDAFKNIKNKLFYLNQKALDEIISYSKKSSSEEIFDFSYEDFCSMGISSADLRCVAAGVDSVTNKKLPETYILIGYFNLKDTINDVAGCILGIEAEDIKYVLDDVTQVITLKQI